MCGCVQGRRKQTCDAKCNVILVLALQLQETVLPWYTSLLILQAPSDWSKERSVATLNGTLWLQLATFFWTISLLPAAAIQHLKEPVFQKHNVWLWRKQTCVAKCDITVFSATWPLKLTFILAGLFWRQLSSTSTAHKSALMCLAGSLTRFVRGATVRHRWQVPLPLDNSTVSPNFDVMLLADGDIFRNFSTYWRVPFQHLRAPVFLLYNVWLCLVAAETITRCTMWRHCA
jgi:hypothetical protein